MPLSHSFGQSGAALHEKGRVCTSYGEQTGKKRGRMVCITWSNVTRQVPWKEKSVGDPSPPPTTNSTLCVGLGLGDRQDAGLVPRPSSEVEDCGRILYAAKRAAWRLSPRLDSLVVSPRLARFRAVFVLLCG